MTRHSCQVVWYCAKKVMVLKRHSIQQLQQPLIRLAFWVYPKKRALHCTNRLCRGWAV
uniref:Uncharacterized protein n=1 Tax=Anguilla anguilla TaxID=7936 RepID=A0A0E9UHL5_ANGAN